MPGSSAPRFYGYVLAGFSFAACFAASSFFLHSRGIFMPYWMEEFSVDRAALSFMISCVLFTGSVVAPLTGFLLDKYPLRRIVVMGWLWLAIGYVLVQSTEDYRSLFLVLLLFQGVGWTYVGPLAQTKLMVNWFSRHRGMALGIAIMGISVAGVVMPVVNTYFAETLGWRQTYLVYAAFLIVVMVPATLFLVRQKPQDIGQWPDGADEAPVAQAAPAQPVGLRAMYMEFLTSKAFWSVVLTFGLMNGVYSALITHLPSYLTGELDYSMFDASFVLSVAGGCAIVGKIVMGWMMDNFPAKVTVMLSVAVYLTSTLVFMWVSSYPMLILAAGLFGLAFGGMVPVRSVLLSRLFGTARFSRVNGLLSFCLAPATFWVAITGLIADRTGSYEAVFQVWAIAFVLAGLVTAFIRLPNREDALA